MVAEPLGKRLQTVAGRGGMQMMDMVISRRAHWATGAIILVTVLILLAMGREAICTCGTVKLWHGDTQSAENSQHLSDWYSLSHIIHGFAFFGLFWWLGRARMSIGAGLVLATIAEAAWEILENSPIIIDRYREATISLGYVGDSVINSLADIGFMTLGFWLAMRLPWQVIVALAVIFEIVAAMVIRDNLTLNVVMLLWPLQSVLEWQGAR